MNSTHLYTYVEDVIPLSKQLKALLPNSYQLFLGLDNGKEKAEQSTHPFLRFKHSISAQRFHFEQASSLSVKKVLSHHDLSDNECDKMAALDWVQSQFDQQKQQAYMVRPDNPSSIVRHSPLRRYKQLQQVRHYYQSESILVEAEPDATRFVLFINPNAEQIIEAYFGLSHDHGVLQHLFELNLNTLPDHECLRLMQIAQMAIFAFALSDVEFILHVEKLGSGFGFSHITTDFHWLHLLKYLPISAKDSTSSGSGITAMALVYESAQDMNQGLIDGIVAQLECDNAELAAWALAPNTQGKLDRPIGVTIARSESIESAMAAAIRLENVIKGRLQAF